MTGARSVVGSLGSTNEKIIFGTPRGPIPSPPRTLIDGATLRYVTVGHEQGAGPAAAGAVMVTGQPLAPNEDFICAARWSATHTTPMVKSRTLRHHKPGR